jgi:PAS domain S-box-containing protein
MRPRDERFAEAFRANPQPMWIASFADARFIEVNDSFLMMSGYVRDEVVGRTASELNICETPDGWAEVRRALERNELVRNFEMKFRTKSGAFRLLLSSAQDLHIGGERCLLVVATDITERQLADEARARLAAIVESSEDAIVSKTLDGKITSWNAAAERLYGYTSDEAKGQSISMIIPAEHAEELSRIIQMIRAGKRVQHLETTRRRKDGSYLDVSLTVSPIVGPEGTAIGASAIARDITERKRAEEALRESESNFRSIFNTVNDAIFVHDSKTGEILDANERAAELYGFSLEEMKRARVGDLSSNLPPYTQEVALKWIGKAFAGQPQVFEWRAKDKHGHLFWVEVSLKRVLIGNKNRLLAVVRDITNRKQTERDLRDLSARLIHSQEEERTRIARELHDDFNQQLAILSIELQELAHEVPDTEHTLSERVQNLWTRAQEISSDLHRLSYQLHPFRLDHLGLAAAMKSLCDELSGHEGLLIEFQQKGFPTDLPGDVMLCVFRIAQESLRNVIKHSGTRSARVYLEALDDAVRLSISDRGFGFNPDSPTAKEGLGLISMRERLRLVGGVMSIRSKPGHGTQIDVLVPVKSEKQLSMAASAQGNVAHRS